MVNLEGIIRNCFEYPIGSYCYAAFDYTIPNKLCNMVIPITGDCLEIPVFLLEEFLRTKVNKENPVDAFVVKLNTVHRVSDYKSIDAIMRNVLHSTYRSCRLVKIISTGTHGKTYYGTLGAIFNENYQPIAMCSWQVMKTSSGTLKYLKPILRVNPCSFINKSDSVERYIVNKLVPTALRIPDVYAPYTRCSDRGNNTTLFKIKVEIDQCPFTIERPDAPSISTTNRNLLDIALNNIDEVVQ